MHSIVQDKLEDIRGLCAQYQVRRLDLFGSATSADEFDPTRSDLDFIVEYESMSPAERIAHHEKLRAELEQLFGRSVDLIQPRNVRNYLFLWAIEPTRIIVYDAA